MRSIHVGMAAIVLAGISGLMLAGCLTPAGSPTATPTLKATFSQAEAIRLGIEVAMMGAPELSGPLEGPFNPHAELVTLADAYQRLGMGASYTDGRSAGQPVWLVSLEGTWRSEAAAPGVTAGPGPLLHHYLIAVDAADGEEIATTLRP